jgi:cysteine desulfurase family protein (TIGR01976 family)
MFDVDSLRRQFPALGITRDGCTPIFCDGPAGTQVPTRVIDAITHYLTHNNANHGGAFATSVESDRLLEQAHVAVADFLNAPSAEEVVFGQNMTSLAFHLGRSLTRVLRPGDEVIVTRLDHDANVTPWVLAARDAGAEVRWIDVHPEDCTLDLETLDRQLNAKTKWVAVGLASNVAGTINDVTEITRRAHAVGAKVFVDAVHYAPHGLIDVQAIGCDFLACSAYKFFGPHTGILWGRRELLESWPVYKLRPSSNALPGKWMIGTQSHECIAGVKAAIEYLADLKPSSGMGRRHRLETSLASLHDYEREIGKRLLAGLVERDRFKVWGIRDPQRWDWRVPTFSFTDRYLSPTRLVEFLAQRHIHAWAGNNYALEISERLGVEQTGGFVRLGLLHYNTHAEVDKVLAALDALPRA